MKKSAICFGLFLLACVTAFLALFWGTVTLEPGAVWGSLWAFVARCEPADKNLYNLVTQVRLPRVCLTMLAGAVLSVVGILMQTLTGNPLAEPYVLGVSSGASAGAAGTIVFRWFGFLPAGHVVFSAFVGSFVAIALVVALQGKSTSPIRLVLTGMGVSAFFQAATTFIIYCSSNEAQARSAQYWLTGSFSGSNWGDVRMALVALAALLVLCRLVEKELDLLLLGQDVAAQSGMNVRLMQLILIVISAGAVSVVVAVAGLVGFVGLIIPHIMRRMVDSAHRYLVLSSALAGGCFLTLADTVARTAFAPQEMPIGVMTAFIGAPVFILMIRRVYHAH
ncbi:MAG: iron ABC transporter permease [Clostridia bacterium]|nr:iron ABC transporter permease [Clostridia bacterium]